MCYCNPSIKTPWCKSHKCQTQLKLYLTDSDIPVETREFKQRYDVLKREAIAATAKLEGHLMTCKHPEEYLTRVSKANTGNYDPSCDSYWYEFKCDLCGSRWDEDQ